MKSPFSRIIRLKASGQFCNEMAFTAWAQVSPSFMLRTVSSEPSFGTGKKVSSTEATRAGFGLTGSCF